MTHILIGWDGSDGARRAVQTAARLMPGSTATVVTAWRSLVHFGFPALPSVEAGRRAFDQEAEQASHHLASQGASHAQECGLQATPATISCEGAYWHGILRAAQEQHCDVIVMGFQGTSAVKTLVMGSTAHSTVQHARIPVMIVPPPPSAPVEP